MYISLTFLNSACMTSEMVVASASVFLACSNSGTALSQLSSIFVRKSVYDKFSYTRPDGVSDAGLADADVSSSIVSIRRGSSFFVLGCTGNVSLITSGGYFNFLKKLSKRSLVFHAGRRDTNL